MTSPLNFGVKPNKKTTTNIKVTGRSTTAPQNRTTMRNNEELKRSHANGFGGSDAKMFAKIGTKGIESLSTTEKKRILVALGKMEADDFGGNVYTEAGHLFEDWCEGNLIKNSEREKYIEREGLAKNFKIFAHADFYDDKTGAVYECKYSQDETMKVYEDYFAQLQWYYMLGVQSVTLVHGWGTVLPFEVPGYCFKDVDKDDDFIACIRDGIAELDKAIEDGAFDDYKQTEIADTDMGGEAAKAVRALAYIMTTIKEAEQLANQHKETLLAWMEAHGVLNIKGEGFTVSYVSPTTRKTFDAKKAQADFPALKDDKYFKTSAVKSSVKITLKQ